MTLAVTIARQYGSGGRQIAQQVARELNASYVDKELISMAAQRLGVTEEDVAHWDERPVSWRERALWSILEAMARSAGSEAYTDYLALGGNSSATPYAMPGSLDEKRYIQLMSGLMQELAHQGNVVIMGRGGNMLLKDWPGVLRVFIIAPFEVRRDRVMQQDQMSAEQAADLIRRTDNQRQAFIRQYFKVEWSDAVNYDLVLNTGKYSLDLAARFIIDAARELGKAQMAERTGLASQG